MNVPPAHADAPVAPNAAAQQQQPAPAIQPAPPAHGAVQPVPAPPARRARNPRGFNPVSTGSTSQGAPALLEISAAAPMYTIQRRAPNLFVPDANYLFHVLSICDQMMGSTHRFLQSSPAWLPIVSQLYISVLWIYQIMLVYVNTGYGLEFTSLARDISDTLRLDECMIPGPLVPFFEALAATNGPFDWLGDVTSALPNFAGFWSADWCPVASVLRSLPVPAVLLDQLAYFGAYQIPAGQTIYGNFEWYRNIFSIPAATHTVNRNRMGPTNSGSLFATESQVNAARTFWNSALHGFTRINAAAGQAALTSWPQLLGLVNQNGVPNYNWLQHICVTMQKYAMYFNGSKPLKSISPTGLGAVMINAKPHSGNDVRNWLYPNAVPGPFFSSRFAPNHEIPSTLKLRFSHADHDIEEIAEQYATLTASNVKWGANNATQHDWTAIDNTQTHIGEYWDMMSHRAVNSINFKQQYAQIVSSRYHQVTALRSE